MTIAPAKGGRLTKLRALLRELGWADTLLYGFARLLQLASARHARFEKFIIVGQPVRHRPQLPPHLGADIEVREVLADDFVRSAFPRGSSVVDHHFAQGAHCLVATRGGHFAGYHWVSLGAYVEDQFNAHISLAPAESSAWNFDLFVSQEQRLGPTFLRLWDATHAYLAARNVDWVLSRISMLNVGSWHAHRRMGARKLGWVALLHVWDLQCLMCSVAPFLHVSTERSRVPELVWRTPPPEA